MELSTLDWVIIGGFFALSLLIGLITARRAQQNYAEFFLSGRGMPWWLLGISMVATTFSADTPNLVTDIVRRDGVAGNWAWWAFLLTGMLTVFVYAKLWRRSGVLTDLEFYELRYSGQAARFLRGFRAVYLGLVFNVFIMATVILAALKIGSVLLGLGTYETLVIAAVVTVVYSALGGLRGIILTDFFQFALAMGGMIWAAVVIVNLDQVGGLNALLAHEAVRDKLSILPAFDDPEVYIPLFIIPLAVQWWSVWYPGAEPGGGGYIVQRMLSAKNESNAIGATFLFNIAHYALRPWPWILIALASLVVFPNQEAMLAAFPNLDPSLKGDDLGFSVMLAFLPAGLLGLVTAGLIAAFMSTISTHLNWGASYLVNDVYKRFIRPQAGERELVGVGIGMTVFLMLLAGLLAPFLRTAKDAFDLILQIGAGTGLIFILRWFWWRVNAWAEVAAMVISFLVAVYFRFLYPGELAGHWQLLMGIGITTIGWMSVMLLTPPSDRATLVRFYQHIRPHAFGWKPLLRAAGEEVCPTSSFASELGSMIAGIFLIYSLLFATGFWLYGQSGVAAGATLVAVLLGVFIRINWRRIQD